MDEIRREATGGPVPMAPRDTEPRFLGLKGSTLRIIGILFLGLGMLIGTGGFLLWVTFTPPSIFTTDFQTVAAATQAAFARTAIMGLGGFLLAAIGIVALWLGMVRPVTSFVARETSPAVGVFAQSAAQGVSAGLAGGPGIPVRLAASPPAAVTVVRVKCRNCGYLDSEDATYCSKCGKPV